MSADPILEHVHRLERRLEESEARCAELERASEVLAGVRAPDVDLGSHPHDACPACLETLRRYSEAAASLARCEEGLRDIAAKASLSETWIRQRVTEALAEMGGGTGGQG